MAIKELQKAFKKLKKKKPASGSTNNAVLKYGWLRSAKSEYFNLIADIDKFLRHAKNEECNCNTYTAQSCPEFHNAIVKKSSSSQWSEQAKNEEQDALARVKTAVTGIDDYALKRGTQLVKGFKEELKKVPNKTGISSSGTASSNNSSLGQFYRDGLRRPWGTEIRQRIAVATGLKQDINNIWQIGLNSIANSASINLGPNFINLINKDPAMKKVIAEINKVISKDIKGKSVRVPWVALQEISGRFQGKKPVELGGKRHPDNMLKQLKWTQSSLWKNTQTPGMWLLINWSG